MSWYAVRTVPGSQMPQRKFVVEVTGSKKGYRIVPSLTPHISAVERALGENGFTYYMPAERRLVRDRRRTDLWKGRRFALMVGYIFVRDPHDFGALLNTPGVAGIVCDLEGRPREIDVLDILAIRGAEAEADAEFGKQKQHARWLLRKKAKASAELQRIVDSLDADGTITVPLDDDALAA